MARQRFADQAERAYVQSAVLGPGMCDKPGFAQHAHKLAAGSIRIGMIHCAQLCHRPVLKGRG